jgi:DNA replication and repair protein RecF
VRITRIFLTHFRSYDEATLDVAYASARMMVLIGSNGAGKTNLLEALSLFAPGRGLRGATLEEMGQQQIKEKSQNRAWSVAIRLSGAADTLNLGTGVTAASPNRRTVRAQGAPAAVSDLPGYLALLWLTPAQDRLFMEGASERRRFLDRLVLALLPDQAGHVARYEHALRERMKLLTDTRTADPAWLSALEARVAEHGVAACAARLLAVQALQPLIAAQPDGPFPQARVGLMCAVADALHDRPAVDVEDWVKVELKNRRAEDGRMGRTSFGPQRSDLQVFHAQKNQEARLCSTGEQKALLLGLVLAQAQLVAQKTHKKPIILLDEVAAHLDADRRYALFEIVENIGGQAWMTGTDSALFSALENRATFISVEDGALEIRNPS